MRKRILVLGASVLVFLAVVIIGIATIFIVDDVSLYFLDNSEVGLAYRDEVQQRVDDVCVGKNILFLREEKISQAFDDSSYVEATSVRKVYPNKIVVYAEEVREIYAVKGENGYSMLDKNGRVLSVSRENKNRADGHTNILLENFGFDGEKFVEEEGFAAVKAIYRQISDTLGGARTNIVGISFVKPTSSAADDYFEIVTQEGVVWQISEPFSLREDKISKLLTVYSSLNTEEKSYGVLFVYEKGQTGELIVTYTSRYGQVRPL